MSASLLEMDITTMFAPHVWEEVRQMFLSGLAKKWPDTAFVHDHEKHVVMCTGPREDIEAIIKAVQHAFAKQNPRVHVVHGEPSDA